MTQLRILIVGNGGREHAFAWKLSQSPLVEAVYVAPGNGGTGLGDSKVSNVNVKGDDYPGLVQFAQKNGVNLVVPGPEAPLVDGIQGYFQAGSYTYSRRHPGEMLTRQLESACLDRPKIQHAWKARKHSQKTS